MVGKGRLQEVAIYMGLQPDAGPIQPHRIIFIHVILNSWCARSSYRIDFFHKLLQTSHRYPTDLAIV